jgi:hypothetical protein
VRRRQKLTSELDAPAEHAPLDVVASVSVRQVLELGELNQKLTIDAKWSRPRPSHARRDPRDRLDHLLVAGPDSATQLPLGVLLAVGWRLNGIRRWKRIL